jgi:hypothetical protein
MFYFAITPWDKSVWQNNQVPAIACEMKIKTNVIIVVNANQCQ